MRLELQLHGRRTAWLTAHLCAVLDVACHEAGDWTVAALTHDIGKLDVPPELLARPGALTGDERRRIELHCLAGAKRLAGSAGPDTGHTTTAAIAVALSHHEWWNGTGYPFGLAGAAIPLCARIVAVADVVDALTSVRSYKPAWSLAAALEEITALRGVQFDPDCVDAMQAVTRALTQDWRTVAEAWDFKSTVQFGAPDAQPRRNGGAHRREVERTVDAPACVLPGSGRATGRAPEKQRADSAAQAASVKTARAQ
jgi:HD-GYP domain-containing protein (c-di-GMP phosphodiesterase class II)